ncbi:MAG: hypothetical protein KF830_05765 [Planctomycetes bacterium]|nr:hypothetical protein [Planctomycetota bacterium]
MKLPLPRLLAPLLSAVLAAAPAAQPPTAQNPFRPFDRARFEALAAQLGATPAQLATFGERVAEVGLARAADDLLRAASPAFDAAVRRHEAGDPAAALELTRVLAGAENPLLQAHARYHLARVFLDSDDPERAIEVLTDHLRHTLNLSPLDGEAAYFYAQALAEVPLPAQAIPRFRAFLQWFPDASERFRAAAHQRLLELERQQESPLHQLADGMKKTARDLRQQKTDKPVQLDQERYVEQLDELIEMFEEMERQSQGAASGTGPSANPAARSALPEGDGSVGNLQKRPSLSDRWGEMKDADRKQIEAAVQQGLPARYQRMLAEYYEKLGKEQGNR